MQFFYNTQTKKLCILGFGWDNHDYDTYKYECGSTILEDDLEFDNGTVNIAKDCESIEIGTQITSIGSNSLKGLHKCSCVDIVGQSYSKSKFEDKPEAIYHGSFSDMGIFSSKAGRGVDMPFLKSIPNLYHRLYEPNEWADGTRFNYNGKYYNCVLGWHNLSSEEEKAQNDFFQALNKNDGNIYPEETTVHDSDEYVFHVMGGKNYFYYPINGKPTRFDYDIRGFFGDWKSISNAHRNAQMQFFYNTETKELNVVCFDCNLPYKTCQYSTFWRITTVFEDTLEFQSGYKYCIADNAHSLYIDPKITEIETASFQSMKNLASVEFINDTGLYSKLADIDSDAFMDCAGNISEGMYFTLFDSEAFTRERKNDLLTDSIDQRFSWRHNTKYYTIKM